MTTATADAIPAGETSGIAARLIATTRNLVDLIEQENQFLEAHKTQEIKPLQAEKSRLAAQYQDDLKAVRLDRALLGAEGSLIRLELQAVTEDFQNAIKNHGRILLRKKTVGDGMIQAIGIEVDRQKRPVRNYSPSSLANRNRPTSPTSIALNEVI